MSRVPPTRFEYSGGRDEDSDSDSDGCMYYNVPNFVPPTPPRPQNLDTGMKPRPKPPPRRKSNQNNNTVRDSSVPGSSATGSPISEERPRMVTHNKSYELHTPRYNYAKHESPSPVKNGKADDMESYDWYWGNISRSDAEQKLKDLPDGSFLVRDSTTPGDYTLTVRKAGQSKCLKIYQKDGSFGLKLNECAFNSVLALIEHYTQNSLADFNRRLDVNLNSCPSRSRAKKSANRYESLSALADVGRQLQLAKQKYILLKEEQVEYSKTLDCIQIKERAYKTAKAMFGQFMAPTSQSSRDDFVLEEELSAEQRKMLEENKSQATERQAYFDKKADDYVQQTEFMELKMNNATMAVNLQVEELRDVEENCEIMRSQILEEGASGELLACLVEECTVPHPDRSLWMVDCSRDEAVELLSAEPAGTFLIRPRYEPDRPYALSIVSCNEDGSTIVKHCAIHHPTGCGYGFRADSAVFESIDELVCKHGKRSIKVYFTHIDTCLDHPIRVERPRSLGELSDNSQGFNDNST